MSANDDRRSRSHDLATSDGGPSLWTKVFFALVILGLAAGGIGSIKTYLDKAQ